MQNFISILFGAVAGLVTGFLLVAVLPSLLKTEEQRAFAGAFGGALAGAYGGMLAGDIVKGEKNPNRFLLGLVAGLVGGSLSGYYFDAAFTSFSRFIDSIRPSL